MLVSDIGDVLKEYYRWSKVKNPANIGYPPTDTVRKLLGSSVPSLGITDVEAETVDRALCVLKSFSPLQHWILEMHYEKRHSISWIAGRERMDRRTVSSLASAAEHFVHGVLVGAEVIEKPVEHA